MLWAIPEEATYALTGSRSPFAGVQAPRGSRQPGVARSALIVPADPTWKGNYKFSRYEGFEYHRKRIPGLTIRLDRYGTGKSPFYRIKAVFHASTPNRSGRFLEQLGYWDPMLEVDHPKFFKMKCDRAVFWLRQGARPTDMVASLLDRAGIIRRTGMYSKGGEWEWRVPKDSGPEAPEGWKYDGPHEVTWGNKPMRKKSKNRKPFNIKTIKKLPLVERHGFKGYERIPIERDVLSEPVTKSALLEAFGNTQLPMY